MSRPDLAESVFTGRVVATENGRAPEGTAITVVQVEQVVSGSVPSAVVRLAVQQLMADCSSQPIERSALEKSFPDGARVAVIARRASPGSGLLQVEIGGSTEIALLGTGFSDRFAVRQGLVSLSRKPAEATRVAILTGLISNPSGELDFERTVRRFIPSKRYRTQLLASYREYWAQVRQ